MQLRRPTRRAGQARRVALLSALWTAFLAFALPASLRGQAARTVAGQVVRPGGPPLAGVDVRAVGTYLGTVTDRDGRFRLELPAGVRRLRFLRIGYRTRTVPVGVERDAAPDSIRVTLEPRPVELKGLSVEGRRGEAGEALGHTVTTETVRQAPALGEPDVFRSLVYLPGVSQPNDLKGRIHLAGGSSDETGYRLDGHPLQEPFHLLGLLGAFNVAALERADVLIHRYPISEGGRLGGLIDLHTRRGGEPATEAVVSLLSSSLTTVRPELAGGLDVLASARVTYLDRVAPLLSEDLPRLGYYDGLLRLGRSWGGGWRAELLGFTTQNHFRGGDIKDLEEQREPLGWGESLAGLRLARRTGAWRLSLRGSANRAVTSLDERPVDDDVIDATRDWWSGGLTLERRAAGWRVTAGASVDHRRHRQSWDAGSLADELFSPSMPGEFSGSDELTTTALFGELSVDLGERLRATAGGRAVAAGGAWHPAPRGLLTFEAGDALALEVSAERRVQFDAEIEEPVEGSIIPPRFLLASPRRADLFAAAAEWAPGELPVVGTEGRLRLVGFWREYPDRPTLVREDPLDPGTGIGPDFPTFRRVEGRSAGASLGLRFRIGEEGLFQGSYTYQRAREEVEGELFPTTWDAPHSLSLFASVPVFGDWTGNAAFRLHSGRAATPVVGKVFVPRRGFGDNGLLPRFFFGDRNSLRLERYARLDLGLRHRFEWLGADWVFFGQVLNVLRSENPIDVEWEDFIRARASGGRVDGIQGGLPILPSFGLEARW